MEGIVLALLVCLVLACVTKYLGVPSIPFYIIAGIALGKSGLNLVSADSTSQFFTDLGLIFLLFFMGLELNPSRIIENRTQFLRSGLIDLNVNLFIGFIAAYIFGFTLTESLVVGVAFFVSSTAMTLTSLIENRKLMMHESETIVWMMVFEDLVLIIALAFLARGDSNPLFLFLKVILMFLFFAIIGKYGKGIIKGILKRDDDLPVLFTFSAVLAIAFFSQSIGVPDTLMVIAFGAALAASNATAFEVHAKPFKDVFLVIFFVFFGISVDLSGGISIIAAVVISVLALASKFISGLIIGLRIHGRIMSGIEIGVNTIGRGEFSIALATIFGSAAVSTMIAVVVITTSIIGAFLARYSDVIKAKCMEIS